MKKCLLFCVIFLSTFLALGQESNFTLIHLDKSFYVTGETIWYKVFLPKKIEWNEAVLDVQLALEGSELMESFRIEAGTNMAHGGFKIPYGWSSGQYLLTISTNDLNNSEANILVQKWVAIYNDLEEIENDVDLTSVKDSVGTNVSDPSGRAFQSSDARLEISMDTTQYSRRDEISFWVSMKGVSNSTFSCSISVIDIGLTKGTDQGSRFAYKDFSQAYFEPERNIVVRGMANYADAGSRTYAIGMGAFDRFQGDVHLFSTDLTGAFSLKIPKYTGKRSLQFQDYFGREVKLKFTNIGGVEADVPKLKYNDQVLSYLKASADRKKINQYFNPSELNLLENNNELIPFMKPNRSIILSDYEKFSSMEEFFKNIVAPLKVFKEGEDIKFKMVNPKNKPYFEGDPLFIIDRYVVRDANYIGNLSLEEIDKIDLYFDQDQVFKSFGYLGRGGVVAIYTKEGGRSLPGRLKKNLFEIKGVQKSSDFPSLDKIDKTLTVPYFRPTIYWNPEVTLNGSSPTKVTFEHSDDRSEFEIEIIGVTSEGEVLMKKETYQVN